MQDNSARTVLIVEPDEDSRAALRSALEGDGYTVISTATATDALSVVDGPRINLIVTELYLGSGADRCLLHTIRQTSATKRHRVLAYTRHGRAEDRAWAIAEGANGYVLKKNGEARMLEVAGRLSSPRAKRKRDATRRRKNGTD
ncbi:MAG TPA: response regulator [Gemmatimonadaceae bacterium]